MLFAACCDFSGAAFGEGHGLVDHAVVAVFVGVVETESISL
jgi:hypothetical protein